MPIVQENERVDIGEALRYKCKEGHKQLTEVDDKNEAEQILSVPCLDTGEFRSGFNIFNEMPSTSTKKTSLVAQKLLEIFLP